MYLDGSVAVGENSQSIKERRNLSLNGYLEITLILNNSGKLSKPVISYRGIPEKDFDEKTENGADLVQLYTGFIYEGPAVARNILS
mgnify:CR=1 FL=1